MDGYGSWLIPFAPAILEWISETVREARLLCVFAMYFEGILHIIVSLGYRLEFGFQCPPFMPKVFSDTCHLKQQELGFFKSWSAFYHVLLRGTCTRRESLQVVWRKSFFTVDLTELVPFKTIGRPYLNCEIFRLILKCKQPRRKVFRWQNVLDGSIKWHWKT